VGLNVSKVMVDGGDEMSNNRALLSLSKVLDMAWTLIISWSNSCYDWHGLPRVMIGKVQAGQ